MSNLPLEGLPALQPWTGPWTLNVGETTQCRLSPCPLLLSASGLTEPPPGTPILFSALPRCPVVSGMPETENLLSLASVRPRDLRLFPPHPPGTGVRGFPQPDTHQGPHEECSVVPSVCPPRAPELWWDTGSLPLPSFPHTHSPARRRIVEDDKLYCSQDFPTEISKVLVGT